LNYIEIRAPRPPHSCNIRAREAVADAMGYTATSGKGSRAIASLQGYGLLEKRGKGECGVTELAMRILYPESDEERIAAIRDAFANAKVFFDLLQKFGYTVPGKVGVVAHLKRNNFGTNSAELTAKVFLSNMKWMETINAYEGFAAPPADSENMAALLDQSEETIIQTEEKPMIQRAPESRFTDVSRGPVGAGGEYRLLLTEPLTETIVDDIMASLMVHKKILSRGGGGQQEYLPASN
ncbi:MAG: hypothetical protein OXE54_10805, partial [Gammaproteobacteria bacterium]|nr:hypothetical protein [Gammaproteobacteria bacterium]